MMMIMMMMMTTMTWSGAGFAAAMDAVLGRAVIGSPRRRAAAQEHETMNSPMPTVNPSPCQVIAFCAYCQATAFFSLTWCIMLHITPFQQKGAPFA
jgi:hypothetical protein